MQTAPQHSLTGNGLRWIFLFFGPLDPLAVVLLAAAVLDVLLTRVVLSAGGVETNPVMAFLFARVGFWPACVGKLALAAWAAAFLPAVKNRSVFAGPGLVFCAVAQVAVVIWGVRVLSLLML